MRISAISTWAIAIAAGFLPIGAECQSLFKPVDISGFGKEHPIQASVTRVSSSECKAVDLRTGVLYDYDITLSGTVIFENRSRKAAILYKGFFPLTGRVAASPKDIASGKFVAGFDGDRMAIGSEPKQVSIDDFAIIGPGESYESAVSAIVAGSAKVETDLLHLPGKYWVQLGIDARPDEFYFDPGTEKDFKNKWRSRGHLVDFILTEPFPIDVALDPNAPLCK